MSPRILTKLPLGDVESNSLPGELRGRLVDLLTGDTVGKTRRMVSLSLQPYEYRWLSIQ
jgi:hypothetical protein